MTLISKARNRRTKARNAEVARRSPRRRIPVNTYLMGLLMWSLALFVLHSGSLFVNTNLGVGQRAPATRLAEVDFEAVDLNTTQLEQERQAGAVLPVFTLDAAPLNESLREINLIFDQFALALQESVSSNSPPDARTAELASLLQEKNLPPDAAALLPEISSNRVETLRVQLTTALEGVYHKGIISEHNRESRFDGNAGLGLISLHISEQETRSPVRVNDLFPPATAAARVTVNLDKLLPSAASRDLLRQLIQHRITPNLAYDQARTQLLREQARKAVAPMTVIISAGTPLLMADELITEQNLANLRAHNLKLGQLETASDRVFRTLGTAGLLLAALWLAGTLLHLTRPELLRAPRLIVLAMALSLPALLLARAALYGSASLHFYSPALVGYIAPLALPALLATMLAGPMFALAVGTWSSFCISLLMDRSLEILLLGLCVSFVAAISARAIQRRSNVFRAGLLIGGVKLLAALVFGALHQQALPVIATQACTGLLGGIAIAFVALLFIPLFEYAFKITTAVRLLELSDMSHPLLQRLALEAPGTYHHSLMVANLVQAAAREVGANELLVRVCAYYHDIGKLTKPEFFIENAQYRDNPHDDLAPSMSTLVIISHVKEGVSMAQRHKLPRPILNAIQQHHGTSVISYFYNRALQAKRQENARQGNPEICPENFRYPGPKPQSIEMGLLMLADTVEAASRAMDKVTPGHIDSLVTQLFNDKVSDGQLDDCGMTFRQLSQAKASFIFALNNMLHGRIPYPPKDENRTKPTPTSLSAESAGNGTAGEVSAD